MADDLVQSLRGYAQADDLLPSERDDLLTAADAIARKDAEIAELKQAEVAWDAAKDWLATRANEAEARAERAEARVMEAPVVTMPQGYAHLEISFNGEFADRYYGKRVALVLLDTEEAK